MRIACGDVFEDPGEEVVARQHADPVSEIDGRRVDAAAGVRLIHDVIVNERRHVDELHVGGDRQVVDGTGAHGFSCEEREARPQALPSRGQHPSHGFGDELVPGRERVAEEVFDEAVQIALARRPLVEH